MLLEADNARLRSHSLPTAVIQAISNHIIEDCIISVGAAQVLTTTLVYSALLTYLHIVIGTDVGTHLPFSP
mgnify:CR=1 FL=1